MTRASLWSKHSPSAFVTATLKVKNKKYSERKPDKQKRSSRKPVMELFSEINKTVVSYKSLNIFVKEPQEV